MSLKGYLQNKPGSEISTSYHCTSQMKSVGGSLLHQCFCDVKYAREKTNLAYLSDDGRDATFGAGELSREGGGATVSIGAGRNSRKAGDSLGRRERNGV